MVMRLVDALPMGIGGAVLQPAKVLAAAMARASGTNRNWAMTDS
jgi:hypothetical protein